MRTLSKKFLVLLTVMTMFIMSCISVFALNNQTASTAAYDNLIKFCKTPWTNCGTIGAPSVGGNLSASYMQELQKKTYPIKDGGYYLYSEVVGSTLAGSEIVDLNKFQQLTTGSKQKFLQDLFKCANMLSLLKRAETR